MAVYYPHDVTCNQCGFKFTAQLAKGINIGRSPELKQKIIDGTFHKVSCPNCSTSATVEKSFSYTDFTTNTFIKVKPRSERHLWKEASLKLEEEVAVVPNGLSNGGAKKLRVVFGMAELREKVLAQEVGLDDRMIELLKVFVIHEHPFLIQKSLIRISFDSITEEAITFSIQYDHQNKEFMVSIPRWIAEDIFARENEMKDWVKRNHPKSNIFEIAQDHWVNIWRWSPQPSSLDQLKKHAEKIRNGISVDTNSKEFQLMLSYLPKGTHLPSWGKDALNVLFQYAKKIGDSKLQDLLFEIRFDKILEDDWAYNDDPNDIDTLWKLLSDLPSSNIDGNSFIREIIYDQGSGGGAYNPQTYDIYIGSGTLVDGEGFEDTVRHEVGHAVHEKFNDKVNAWLANEFGWRIFSASSTSDIDAWVALMGGWKNLTPVEISQVRNYLIEALGPGSRWMPSRPNFVPPNHPWFKSDFGPRLAYENTKAHWYSNFANWYQFDNKAFFLNYWYRTLCVVNLSTLELIKQMPSSYAAMSHFEFFAELYALYFDKNGDARSSLPEEIANWMNANIEIESTMMPASPLIGKKDFEWVARPRKI